MSDHTFKGKLAGLPFVSRLAGARGRVGLDYEGETLGGRTVVRTAPDRHGRLKRVLTVLGTQQSAMWVDDPYGELVFPYLQLFDVGIDALASRPLRVLLIGGGGFAWPRHVLATYPDVALDVVEIDPRMIEIARDHFLLDELEDRYGVSGERRLRVICRDGRDYLASLPGGAYDLIANDCFIAGEPAASLADEDAVVLLHHALVPHGIYLANVVSALAGQAAGPIDDLSEVLGTQFACVSVVPCEPESPVVPSNNVVIASDIDRPYPGAWATFSFAR